MKHFALRRYHALKMCFPRFFAPWKCRYVSRRSTLAQRFNQPCSNHCPVRKPSRRLDGQGVVGSRLITVSMWIVEETQRKGFCRDSFDTLLFNKALVQRFKAKVFCATLPILYSFLVLSRWLPWLLLWPRLTWRPDLGISTFSAGSLFLAVACYCSVRNGLSPFT